MYWEGRLWVSKLATPRSASFFNEPKLIQVASSCLSQQVEGSRIPMKFHHFLCKNTRHATLLSGRRLTAHPWRWEAWCCCFFPMKTPDLLGVSAETFFSATIRLFFKKTVFIFVLSLFQQGLWTQLKNIGLHTKTNISQICII